MRLLTWNLNHRAARRVIPPWVPAAIGQQRPDLVVLTEYVQGQDHDRFVEALIRQGLSHVKQSVQTAKQNQILIASRTPLTEGWITAPPLHPAVPSNALHVVVAALGLQLIGFRMPAFSPRDRDVKRAVWQWLIAAAGSVEDRPAIVTGDLNTAPGDSHASCGDCLQVLEQRGWQHALPGEGFSWKSLRHRTTRRIDHTFLSPSMPRATSRYLWDFETLAPDAGSGRVGVPDHAMLIVDG